MPGYEPQISDCDKTESDHPDRAPIDAMEVELSFTVLEERI